MPMRSVFVSLIALSIVWSSTGCQDKAFSLSGSGASDLLVAQAELPRFTDGIGFYWSAEGQTRPFTFTQDLPSAERVGPDSSRVLTLPPDARFYAYGLNVSGGGFQGSGLPPHLAGFGFSYRTESGELQGRWAARFIPLDGFDQPAYEIRFDRPFNMLRFGTLSSTYIAFQVGSGQAYRFRFAGKEYLTQRRELETFLYQALADRQREYSGNVEAAFPGQSGRKLTVRFTSFNEDSSDVQAVVRFEDGQSDELSGRLIGFRTLLLEEQNTGTHLDLRLEDSRILLGSYARNSPPLDFVIDLNREKEEVSEP